MPSPKKRKIRKAIGNIHPAGVLTTTQSTDEFVEVLLSENAHNHAASENGGKSFVNGEVVGLSTADSDDGLLTAGEQDAATALPAVTTITFGTTGPTAGKELGLTGSAGDTVTYQARDGASVLTNAGSNAAPVLVKSDVDGDATTLAAGWKTAIETCHSGTIKVIANGGELTLYQNVEGADGNTAIASDLDNTTVPGSFLGGTDSIAISGSVAHYWFDTTNAQASIALAAAEGTAITASSGILYDPSGPKSKYISGTETVSSGSAKIVVFKPTGWDANDVCAIEIVGDTNSGANIHSADRLTIKALNASYASSSLNAIGDFDLDGTETVAEFTNMTGTINHNIQAQHATANAAGFMVMWERKDTGLEPADIKKGWYVRWNTTAL